MKKLRITIGNRSYDVTVEELGEGSSQQSRPSTAVPASATPPPPVVAPAPSASRTSAASVPGAVHSPMAGTVKSILVKVGDAVVVNQPLAILDAMKMENQIMAPAAGTVSRIDAKEGQSMQEGDVLLVVE